MLNLEIHFKGEFLIISKDYSEEIRETGNQRLKSWK
jgi:hypothetical protein